jgi:hypothetical protein
MSPLNAAICTTTYLERQKCYGPGKKIIFKKQLFYLEVKGQGPTKVITVCDTPPYGHAPTYQISLTYLERNNYLTLRSKSHEGHYGTLHTTLWSCTHIQNIIDLSRKTKMLWPGQENTIQKTIIWPWGQRSRSNEGHYGMRHTALWSCTHIPNIIDLSKETIIWPWCQRSRSHEGHYGTRHTAIWSCTHIPIIIDLPRKAKILWPGQENTIFFFFLPFRSKVKVPQRSLRYATHCLMAMHPHTKYHWPIWQKSYGPDKLHWEEAEEVEEKIRLKQYVSLRSKGRHN